MKGWDWKHLSNQDTWNTYGRRILFIINNGKSSDYNPAPETRTPLQPKDFEFHCAKDFCIQSTSITLLSKMYIQHPPQGLYLYGGNKAISKAEEVETVKRIKGNDLTNLKSARVFIFKC